MKKLIITFAILLTNIAVAQSPLIISKTIEKSNLERIEVLVEIPGEIEIDGHVFDNKKSKNPIHFRATLEGTKIYDSKKEYTYRKCGKEKCEITHLEEASYYLNIKGNNLLYHTNYERNTN